MNSIYLLSLLCIFAVHQSDGEEIVRLTSLSTDTTTVTGNVEIYNEGEWQPLCGRLWSLRDAEVICKTVGFAKGAAANLRHPLASSESKQKHWYYLFEGFECTGKETSITECKNWNKPTPGMRNCSVGRAAAQCKR